MTPVSQLLAEKGSDIYSLKPSDPVIDGIRLMAEKSVGALLVMEGEQLLGILSERDYARKVILLGRSSKDTPVSAIMTPTPLVTVKPSNNVRECMRLMHSRRIRHLPVVEGDKVMGVLSIGDIVRAIIQEQDAEIQQLTQYIAG
ncbi:MAG: CBS domain-containing protein [Xanthomonadales bacterium]|nr:CBS domain-containing protein [Xanthomonadales bacterium]MCP5473537.1 CBS domain-containing protein [Rhodanobacteraceae bacterium]